MSYPYYKKHAILGDRTWFRHIDVNVARAVQTQRGLHTIQGHEALNEEDEQNCTEIVPDMRHRLREWHNRVALSSPGSQQCCPQITKDLYSPEDTVHFQSDWTAMLCRSLDARITHPSLPITYRSNFMNGYKAYYINLARCHALNMILLSYPENFGRKW